MEQAQKSESVGVGSFFILFKINKLLHKFILLFIILISLLLFKYIVLWSQVTKASMTDLKFMNK